MASTSCKSKPMLPHNRSLIRERRCFLSTQQKEKKRSGHPSRGLCTGGQHGSQVKAGKPATRQASSSESIPCERPPRPRSVGYVHRGHVFHAQPRDEAPRRKADGTDPREMASHGWCMYACRKRKKLLEGGAGRTLSFSERARRAARDALVRLDCSSLVRGALLSRPETRIKACLESVQAAEP